MIVGSGYRKNGFDAFAGKYLQKSDMKYWINSKEIKDPEGVCFGLGEEIEEVEPGFFEILPTIDEIWMMNPDCKMNMTENTLKLFHKNNVLIRGRFDTGAEKFAEEYHLRFMLLDTELAQAGEYDKYGVDIITLRFYGNGSAYIHQDCKCPGSSAGTIGGGEISFDLPKNFYRKMSAEDIAEKCWGSCYEKIIENGILASILEKAKEKNGFLIDYRK